MEATQNPFGLSGRTVLVTGASSGIGRATAIACSRMGARVVLTGRDGARLDASMHELSGEGHTTIAADLLSDDDTAMLVEKCPVLDGVVHCAGISDHTPARAVSRKTLERVMDTNFNAPVLLQKGLLRKKKIAAGASIVFLSSRAASIPAAGNGVYAASKGALSAYAKVLSLELAQQKIRVNTICPAVVWTELIQREAETYGIDYRKMEGQYPLGRLGRPDDIANLAVFLLSDASGWMTGSSIDITGGTLTI